MPDRSAVRLVADTWLRGPAGQQPAHTYWPPATGIAPPLLVFLSADGIKPADPLCRAVCTGAGMVVLCVSHRQPPWPDGWCDVILATDWAADHARELGADPDRLLIADEGLAPNWRRQSRRTHTSGAGRHWSTLRSTNSTKENNE